MTFLYTNKYDNFRSILKQKIRKQLVLRSSHSSAPRVRPVWWRPSTTTRAAATKETRPRQNQRLRLVIETDWSGAFWCTFDRIYGARGFASAAFRVTCPPSPVRLSTRRRCFICSRVRWPLNFTIWPITTTWSKRNSLSLQQLDAKQQLTHLLIILILQFLLLLMLLFL